jgi:hypothetical protein
MQLAASAFDGSLLDLPPGTHGVNEPVVIRHPITIRGAGQGVTTLQAPHGITIDLTGKALAVAASTVEGLSLIQTPITFRTVAIAAVNRVTGVESQLRFEGCTAPTISDVRLDHANNTTLSIHGPGSFKVHNSTFRNRQVGFITNGPPVYITGPVTSGTWSGGQIAGAGPFASQMIIDTYYYAPGWVSIQVEGPHRYRVGDTLVLSDVGPANGAYTVAAVDNARGILQFRTKVDGVALSGGDAHPPIAGLVIDSTHGPVNECAFNGVVVEGLTADHTGALYPDKREGSTGVLLHCEVNDIYRHAFYGCHFDMGWDSFRARTANHINVSGCSTSSPSAGLHFENCSFSDVIGLRHRGQRTSPVTGALLNPRYDSEACAVRVKGGGVVCTHVETRDTPLLIA